LLFWRAANAAPRFLDHREFITASPIIKVLQHETDDLFGTDLVAPPFPAAVSPPHARAGCSNDNRQDAGATSCDKILKGK
jgi:hypothetical protein